MALETFKFDSDELPVYHGEAQPEDTIYANSSCQSIYSGTDSIVTSLFHNEPGPGGCTDTGPQDLNLFFAQQRVISP